MFERNEENFFCFIVQWMNVYYVYVNGFEYIGIHVLLLEVYDDDYFGSQICAHTKPVHLNYLNRQLKPTKSIESNIKILKNVWELRKMEQHWHAIYIEKKNKETSMSHVATEIYFMSFCGLAT